MTEITQNYVIDVWGAGVVVGMGKQLDVIDSIPSGHSG
jgi:hypothetical protein